MGFFDRKAECGVCGKEVGMNRYKIRQSDAWCCPECFKKANAFTVVNVNKITIEEIKKLIEPKTTATGQYDMNTAQGMDDYARENGYFYTGDTALKHFVVIQENLLPGENVLMALASNSVYNGTQILMGGITAIAFTNKRIIYGQKGGALMGSPVKAVNLDNVNDVQKDTFGVIEGKICIDTIKENICFSFPKSKLDRIFVDVMQILETYRTPKNAAPVVAAVSNADELKKYKELLDMGVITQEEFDAKKKQILGL